MYTHIAIGLTPSPTHTHLGPQPAPPGKPFPARASARSMDAQIPPSAWPTKS